MVIQHGSSFSFSCSENGTVTCLTSKGQSKVSSKEKFKAICKKMQKKTRKHVCHCLPISPTFSQGPLQRTDLMRGIAQQRLLLDHALGHAQSHISWSDVRIEFRIFHGFSSGISKRTSMDLHQVFGALIIVLRGKSQQPPSNSCQVLAIAQARINRLASQSSTSDILHHAAGRRLQRRIRLLRPCWSRLGSSRKVILPGIDLMTRNQRPEMARNIQKWEL